MKRSITGAVVAVSFLYSMAVLAVTDSGTGSPTPQDAVSLMDWLLSWLPF